MTKEKSDPGKWFEAFQNNTNQKQLTKQLLAGFLSKAFPGKKDLKLLDIGCASASLTSDVIKDLGNTNIFYIGIDGEEEALSEARLNLVSSKVTNPTLIKGDCFSKGIQKDLPEIDVMLASHVGYYAKDVAEFTGDYMDKLSPKGVAVFIHDAPESDINQLRTDFAANIKLNTASVMEENLRDNYDMRALSYKTLLQFPENMNQLWEPLETRDASHIPNFEVAKHLLEFVVQQPLEKLKKEGELPKYLDNVKEKLGNQNNCLIIRSRLQVAVRKDHETGFEGQLGEAFESLKENAQGLEKITTTPQESKIMKVA
ncbi:MAG: methyltransferase domain-containing protein [Rickettsiales bacterium]|nr:methyltransferase domain-containing protein [Pseudomonadota bacterium]MDA0967081.1 methyltransferase domain-containing protein [Pseudomonadota bacterium]MDG4542433.1 methyltransferase domain-containing protein [Rickettsiales bacterium]MDG4544937.1 methyltransferase domain-containing protein [Rickettsiales bacterium]MDG4547060.1 methyltransferase domain-containing protein [Rickettsiales bacterium]